MMQEQLHLTIIMPALNEEKNVKEAIENTLAGLDDCQIDGDLIVIDDGSTDQTGELIAAAMGRDDRVGIIRHKKPMGIGTAFWEGVDLARGNVVCMLPGDNENDPWEIFQYIGLMEHVDIVIPFVFNRQARSAFRNVLSFMYRIIINTTFMMNFNYTNGTILWRREVLRELRMGQRSTGFFFQTDALIRLVKRGYLFAEVPYRLGMRQTGTSKAVSFPSFIQVMRGYVRLLRDIHFSRFKRRRWKHRRTSATLRRHSKTADMAGKSTGATK